MAVERNRSLHGFIALWLAVAAGLMAIWPAPGGAAPGAPGAADFARWPAIDDVRVSPSGRRLALLSRGNKGFMRLAVLDLDPIGSPRIVAGYGDADISDVHWVDDDRLVYMAYQRGPVISDGGAGAFAVDHDGSNPRQLIAWRHSTADRPGTGIESRTLPYGWFLHSAARDDSGDVFVVNRRVDGVNDLQAGLLYRMNSRTGQLRNLSLGAPDGVRSWYLDTAGQPRMVAAYIEGRQRLYQREGTGTEWRLVYDLDPLADNAYSPWHIDRDGQVLVASRKGRDTEAIFRFDPKARTLDAEPLVAVNGFDLNPTPITDRRSGRLLGLRLVADRPMTVWLDERMQRLQQGIDAALPADRHNTLLCERCESNRFHVVFSWSDRQPGEYLLLDSQKSTFQPIGARRPAIDEATQGKRSFHRLKARDGLMVPIVVTHPPGARDDERLPAVMLVHGGPWVRGSTLAWDQEAQFLATRGWRVLQPEFRGSEGFGARHERAGRRQWGRAMQDDLVDSVQWAAERGWVDPAKVCIVGASYGGYAALMGPIAHPGAWRCAASFVGVTDIDLMFSAHWSDVSIAGRKYGYATLIGDPKADAERLAQASPLRRVGEIKVPVLLAHGALDRRVPLVHFNRFRDAAERAGVPVESHVYLDDAHGFYTEASQADWYRRLEKFIGKALGPAP